MVGFDLDHAENAVMLGRSFVAAGQVSGPVLELAGLPNDPKRVTMREVRPLVREIFDAYDLALPFRMESCWIVARFIADQMLAGLTAPLSGARQLWALGLECGQPVQLMRMDGLLDRWEETVPGPQRDAVELAMLRQATEVLAADGPR
jgi:hypothetical protein